MVPTQGHANHWRAENISMRSSIQTFFFFYSGKRKCAYMEAEQVQTTQKQQQNTDVYTANLISLSLLLHLRLSSLIPKGIIFS